MIDILYEYGGEFLLCLVYIICTLFGRKKTAEEIKQKAEKKRDKALMKASKFAVKSDKQCAKAEKIDKEVLDNDTIS